MQPTSVLKDKRIILGVTGSIAVYKAVDLASKLTQAGVRIDVIMTDAAQHFVTPLTFQSVTGRPVYTTLWQTDSSGGLPTHIAHVGLAEGADLLIVSPATANTIARIAHGFADDLLSVTAIAARCPIAIAPAMDGGMYESHAVQTNLQTLQDRHVFIIPPESGRFASGLVGVGRLPETATLIGHIRRLLGMNGPLQGKKIVITAGGTKEAIDPVRYITNRSSGKQGYALAQAALDSGAMVTLITTTDHLPIPIGATGILVESADAMLNAVEKAVQGADALIMAAAVADFKPATIATQKIKKSANPDEGLTIELARTADILIQVKSIREQMGFPRVVVGFAAESHDLIAYASDKLARKGLDFIVANDITAADAGFAVDTNRVTILATDGSQTPIDLMSKADISAIILERIAQSLNSTP